MVKGKLLAIIGGSMSVVVAATTALTLALSGPRDVKSLNALSENEAVSEGVSNLLDSASSTVETVSNVINTISENKAALSMGVTINEIEDLEELSGLGANLNISFDYENNQYSIDGNVVYGAVELLNAVLYMDEKEAIVSVPALFEGIVKLSYDNLAEDLENSYIGDALAAEGFDFEEFEDEFMTIVGDATAAMPAYDYDFDFETFAEELGDVMSDAYDDAIDNMTVTDNGKQALTGGKYQSYTASIPVADLSYIVRDGLIYVLESEDFQNYVDYLMEYMEELEGSYEYGYDDTDSYDYSDIYGDSGYETPSYGEQLASMAPVLESYWGMVVSELEGVLGKNIEFTLYLTDAVETAGFEFYASVDSNGSFNYSKTAATSAEAAIVLKGDFTGGKNIGDYTAISLEGLEYGEQCFYGSLTSKMEENGDFVFELTGNEYGESFGLMHIDGSYTENDMFFTLDIDSFKLVDEDGDTAFDIGMLLSFKPIDGVNKPSGSPEYSIWDMDEDDFEALVEEISNNLDDIEDALN